jgi:hypothetical protein
MMEGLLLLPFVVVAMVVVMVTTLWVLERVAKTLLWLTWQFNKAIGAPGTIDPFK